MRATSGAPAGSRLSSIVPCVNDAKGITCPSLVARVAGSYQPMAAPSAARESAAPR